MCLGAAGVLAVGLAALPLRPAVPPSLPANWGALVSVLAGDGVAGVRDGAARQARFSEPFGIAVAPDGSLLVSDAGHSQRIRRIASDGSVSTVAEGLNTPSGIAVDATGQIYVADTAANRIVRLSADGSISMVVGGDVTVFNGPLGVAALADGGAVVADTYNDRIRVIAPDGQVRTLAGGAAVGLVDGRGELAQFDTPAGVAVDAAGVVFVADTGNHAVRRIQSDGTVSTVAPAPEGGFFRPVGIAVDARGALFIAEDGGRLIEVVPDQRVRVLAGAGLGFTDGPGEVARFRALSGVAVLGEGVLVVADRRNALVREVAWPPRRQLRPPPSPRIAPHFDVDTFIATPLLWPVHPQEGPYEVTGTMGELRGGDGSERFHAGLDVRAEEGTVVRAVRDGVVIDPVAATDFNTLNEALRIGDVVYVHQRIGRTARSLLVDPRLAPAYDAAGQLVRVRVKRGSRFRVGDALGTTNAFNHVHLNVGWPREEVNPLRARPTQLADTVPPTIARGGIVLLDELGMRLSARVAGRLVISGRLQIVVDAWDQMDGNRADRRLGLHRLGYQVFTESGDPAPGFERPRETLRFDALAPDEAAARAAYAPGSGIPFFGRRRTRFLYRVTSELRGGYGRQGAWDADALPPGNYRLHIIAMDAAGNAAIANSDLAVTRPPVASP